MDDISRYKTEVRVLQVQLRALLNEWDPIGVGPDDGGPKDEYDCLLPMIGWLRGGMSQPELADRLRDELKGHFGIDATPSNPEAFADRAFDWYWTDPLPGSVEPAAGG
jgi:hypothetical protein